MIVTMRSRPGGDHAPSAIIEKWSDTARSVPPLPRDQQALDRIPRGAATRPLAVYRGGARVDCNLRVQPQPMWVLPRRPCGDLGAAGCLGFRNSPTRMEPRRGARQDATGTALGVQTDTAAFEHQQRRRARGAGCWLG